MAADSERSDTELLAAWRAGDRAAGTQLVRRHFPIVHRFFTRKLPTDLADDLIQATFAACVTQRDRVHEAAGFRAFLLGVARIELLRYFRKRGRHDRAMQIEAMSLHELQSSPSRIMARHEQTHLLLEAVRRIALDLQIVLELYYWEELSVAEIGAVLEIPAGTVKSRLARARAALAKQMDALAMNPDLARDTLTHLGRWARLSESSGDAPG